MSLVNAASWAQVVATAIAALALLWGLWNFRQTSRLQHYTELDRLYFEIVALRVAHTHLGDPKLVARMALKGGTEKALRYDSYALLIWNFIETIFDRCKQADLFETWKPILQHEGELHREWFARNLGKFKYSFRRWASRAIPKMDTLVDADGELIKPVAISAACRPAAQPLHYDAASVELARKLIETVAAWEAGLAEDIDETARNWRIAEALHLATWQRPHAHAPLSLLLDEERIALSNPATA